VTLEIKFNQSQPVLNHRYAFKFWKTQICRRKPRKALNSPRSVGITSGLAPLGESFRKYQKGNATYRTDQSSLIIFFNAVQNTTIKRYLEVAAIRPHRLVVL